MAVIDVFTFNGEYDLLEIRLNILNDYVDEFIIVEAPTTFSGKPKPLYYEAQKDRYKKWHDKIRYYVIDESYTPEETSLAESSPNTRGASHWKHEFLQKESIKKTLTHLKDDDVVIIGDCDEIYDPKDPLNCLDGDIVVPLKVGLRVYTYWLNNRSSEEFYGPIIAPYGLLKNKCLNHIRSTEHIKTIEAGWHFTSLRDGMKRKLEDSYTKETYANDWVMTNLEENIKQNKDFLGRGFTYKVDESGWPQWLKDNRQKYLHLLK